MKLHSEFGFGDSVIVKQLQIGGIVTGVLFENAGIQYRVVFWTNGERRQEWMFEGEVYKPINPSGRCDTDIFGGARVTR